MKTCTRCEAVMTEADFYKQPRASDGLMSVCKACHKAAVMLRRRTNPAVQAYDRERAKRPERKAHARRITQRFRKDHPLAARAHAAVSYALKAGTLKREPCLFCATTEHVHGHHRDYAKPLDVTWLCAKCHHRLHATFPETAAHERMNEAA